MKDILKFDGDHRFLSNFTPGENPIVLDGLEFATVEHAYVAAKTLDMEIRKQVQLIETPGQVKRFGRKIKLRDDWEDVKIAFMTDFVRQKFAFGTKMADKLLATKCCQLVEGNTWGDTFWGVCNGVGENNLGKILMIVRDELNLFDTGDVQW